MSGVQAEIADLMVTASVYEGFLNALIGGATSLLSGVFGRSDAKKRDKAAAKAAKVPQVTTNTVDAVAMVAEAERAGFNPVTFLNAGGLAGFTTSTTTGHNAMAAVPTAPSFGSVLAGAAQTGFDIWRQDSQIKQQQSFEKSLVSMQLGAKSTGRAVNARSASAPASMAAPRVAVAGALKVGVTPLGAPTVPEVGDVTVTNPYHIYDVEPTVRDAESGEARGGEIVGEVQGWRATLNDFWKNVTGEDATTRKARTLKRWKEVGGPIVQWQPRTTPASGSVLFSMPGITVKSAKPANRNAPVVPNAMKAGGW